MDSKGLHYIAGGATPMVLHTPAMILRKAAANLRKFEKCQGGKGSLWCSEILADYQKTDAGFTFILDNVIEPGGSIGEHQRINDEEIYIILSGHGIMTVDGVEHPVGEGDVCLSRSGHSHSLVNSTDGPMRFMVINAKK